MTQIKIIDIEEITTQNRDVKGFIDFMATDGQYIWATNQDKVQKFHLDHSEAIAEIHVPKAAGIPVYAFSALWVASLEHHSIYKIDPISNEVLAVIATGLADKIGELSLTACTTSIWLASSEGIISKIDPHLNQVIADVHVRKHSYNLCFDGTAIWLSNTRNSSVQRIDPKTNTVTHTIPVDEMPWFLTATQDYVWTLNQRHGTLSKIDTQTCTLISTIQLPALAQGDGGDIFAYEDIVWVRTTHLLLIEVDARTDQIIRKIQHIPTTGSGAVMYCDRHIWVTAHDIEKLWIYPV